MTDRMIRESVVRAFIEDHRDGAGAADDPAVRASINAVNEILGYLEELIANAEPAAPPKSLRTIPCDECELGDEYDPEHLQGDPNPDAWPGCRGGWGFAGDGSPGWFEPCEVCRGVGRLIATPPAPDTLRERVEAEIALHEKMAEKHAADGRDVMAGLAAGEARRLRRLLAGDGA